MDEKSSGHFLLLVRRFKRQPGEAAPKTSLRLEYTILLISLVLLALFVAMVLHALAS